MTKFLRRVLTNDVLQQSFDGRYQGRIVAVAPEQVFNRFRLTTETVPLVTFDDGWTWVPNITARRTLTAAWGTDTDDWIGRRMAISLVPVTRTERSSGRLVEKLEKQVEPLPAETASFAKAAR